MKYVVIDENLLGYRIQTDWVGILHASVLKGCHYNPLGGPIPVPMDASRMRDATAEDFQNFRVKTPPDFQAA